jgi:excisionase family DNA binding protein
VPGLDVRLFLSKVPPVNDERLLLDVVEAAGLLGISRTLAYRLAREGRIPTIRLGTRLKVSQRALVTWIEQETKRHDSDATSAAPPERIRESGPTPRRPIRGAHPAPERRRPRLAAARVLRPHGS